MAGRARREVSFELSREYIENPAEHPIKFQLDNNPRYEDMRVMDPAEEIQVEALVHAYTKARKEAKIDGTGKPEAPWRIHYIATYPYLDERSTQHKYLDLSDYWQDPERCAMALNFVYAQRMTITNNQSHPVRPILTDEEEHLYRRQIPSLNEHFMLRVVYMPYHLEKFHEWQNSDRVNAFWGERGDLEHHRSYLQRQLDDPHVIPVIGHFACIPFAYFEIYYAKEDPISKYVPNCGDYDMGWHALVGEEKYRGPHRVEAWISSITHCLFLLDSRTQRVMLEPRVDNVKFIKYLQTAGYVLEKEFNFPHKRAALMTITREKFFETMHGPMI